MPMPIRIRLSTLMPIQIRIWIRIWIRIRILPEVLHMLENQKKYFTYIHNSAREVEMDTDSAPDPEQQALDADPDPPNWCRSVRIRIYSPPYM